MRTLVQSLGVLVLLGGCVSPSTLLVNDEGKVLRCASYGYGSVVAISAAGSIYDSCVKDAKRLGYVVLPEGHLGLNTESLTSPVVKSVTAGAAAAGMQPGDVLLAYDGQPVRDRMQAWRLLSTKAIGDTVQVTVQRGMERLTLPVRVDKRGE